MFPYLSSSVQLIVGELDFLKGHNLPLRQLFPRERPVRVRVEPVGRWRICLAGHKPGRSVVGVTVALGITRDNVQDNSVVCVGMNAREAAPHCGEHPSENVRKEPFIKAPFPASVSCQSGCPFNISVGRNIKKGAVSLSLTLNQPSSQTLSSFIQFDEGPLLDQASMKV